MTDAGQAVQAAMFDALVDDPSVTALVGADGVFDGVPRKAEYPHVVFGPRETRDYSTDDCPGDEHTITVRARTRGRGKRDSAEILAVVRSVLADTDLTLVGHHLVNLSFLDAEITREGRGGIWRGEARFRAVTEPV